MEIAREGSRPRTSDCRDAVVVSGLGCSGVVGKRSGIGRDGKLVGSASKPGIGRASDQETGLIRVSIGPAQVDLGSSRDDAGQPGEI